MDKIEQNLNIKIIENPILNDRRGLYGCMITY